MIDNSLSISDSLKEEIYEIAPELSEMKLAYEAAKDCADTSLIEKLHDIMAKYSKHKEEKMTAKNDLQAEKLRKRKEARLAHQFQIYQNKLKALTSRSVDLDNKISAIEEQTQQEANQILQLKQSLQSITDIENDSRKINRELLSQIHQKSKEYSDHQDEFQHLSDQKSIFQHQLQLFKDEIKTLNENFLDTTKLNKSRKINLNDLSNSVELLIKEIKELESRSKMIHSIKTTNVSTQFELQKQEGELIQMQAYQTSHCNNLKNKEKEVISIQDDIRKLRIKLIETKALNQEYTKSLKNLEKKYNKSIKYQESIELNMQNLKAKSEMAEQYKRHLWRIGKFVNYEDNNDLYELQDEVATKQEELINIRMKLQSMQKQTFSSYQSNVKLLEIKMKSHELEVENEKMVNEIFSLKSKINKLESKLEQSKQIIQLFQGKDNFLSSSNFLNNSFQSNNQPALKKTCQVIKNQLQDIEDNQIMLKSLKNENILLQRRLKNFNKKLSKKKQRRACCFKRK